MTQIEVHKGVAYTVEQPDPLLVAHKAVVYAVEQVPPAFSVHKAVAYVTEQGDPSGNAIQPNLAERPIYRTGPIPHVEFVTGTSLKINVLLPGVYTLLFYKPDDTFERRTETLVAGFNTIDAPNFNQLLIYKGAIEKRLLRRIRLTMQGRVT